MIKGIIFDLDGTLIHLPIKYDIIRKDLQNLFKTNNEFIPLIPSIIQNAPNDKMIHEAFEIICKEELVAADKLEIVDDAIDLLNQLHPKFSLGLVTLQCRKATEKIISKMGVDNLFLHVLTLDESTDRINQIEKMVALLNLSSDEVVMIGDRLNDVVSATKVGCNSILVGNKKLPQNEHKIRVVAKLSDLKNERLLEF